MDEDRFIFKMGMIADSIEHRREYICIALDRSFVCEPYAHLTARKDFQALFSHMENHPSHGMFGWTNNPENQEKRLKALKKFKQWAIANKAYERYEG